MKISNSLSYGHFCLIFLYFILSAQELLSQRSTWHNQCQMSKLYLIENEATPNHDETISTLLSVYKDSLQIHMMDSIVLNRRPLSKTQPESTLGNWLADAALLSIQKAGLNIDAALISYSSIGKAYFGPGILTRRDIYELVPYNDVLTLVQLNGIQIQALCDTIAQNNGGPVSGLIFKIKERKAYDIKINQGPLNDHLIYTLVVDDYMRRSKKLSHLFNERNTQLTAKTLRQALFEFSYDKQQQGGYLEYELENRISYAE